MHRSLAFSSGLLAATALLGGLISVKSASLAAQARQENRQTSPGATSYTGAGSCTSSNCHGSVWPRTGGKINQNEYLLWSTKDKHSKAYAVLLEPRSKQI